MMGYPFLGVCYNLFMNENPKYTIDIVPVGDHLQVSVPELGIVLETTSGKTRRDDAVDLALSAISEWQQKQSQRSQVKAS
jgi:hypothetical protein